MPSTLLKDSEIDATLTRFRELPDGAERDVLRGQLSTWRDNTDRTLKLEREKQMERMYEGFDSARQEIGNVPMLDQSPDPEETLAGGLNQRYVADALGKSVDEISTVWPQWRSAYALRAFGKDVKTDKELYGMIGGKVKQWKAQREFSDNLRGAAVLHAFEDIASGNFTSPTERVRAEIAKNPEAFGGLDEADVLKNYSTGYSGLRVEMRPYKDVAKKTFDFLSSWTGAEEFDAGDEKTRADVEQLARGFIDMPADERQKVWEVVALAAKAKGAGDSKVFFQRLGESFARGAVGAFDETAIMLKDSEVRQELAALKSGKDYFVTTGAATGEPVPQFGIPASEEVAGRDFKARRPTAEETVNFIAEREDLLKQTQVLRELKALADGSVDPIKPIAGGMLGKFEGGLYSAAQSVPYTLVAGIPAVGLPLTYTALAAADYNRQMLANPDMDSGAAMNLAMLTAAPQAAIEKVQFGLLTAKLPVLSEAMTAMAKASTPTAIRVAAGLTGIVVAENVTEGLQDAVPVISDTLAAAIRKDMPNFDAGKAWGDWAGETPDRFFAILPLSLVGGGALTVQELRRTGDFLEFKHSLRVAGFSETAAGEVAAEQDPEKQTEMIVAGWDQRTPEDIAAGKEMLTESQKAAQVLQSNPEMPTIDAQRAPDGSTTYVVKDEAGKEIWRTQDATAAMQAQIDQVQMISERQLAAEAEAANSDEAQLAAGREGAENEIFASNSEDWGSVNTGTGDDFTDALTKLPEPDISNIDVTGTAPLDGPKADRAISIANDTLRAQGGTWQLRQVPANELHRTHRTDAAKLARAVAGLFGRRVVIFDSVDGGFSPHNAFVNSSPELRDVIFLHNQSPRPHMLTIGHELYHHIELSAPTLAAQLRAELEPLIVSREKLAGKKADYPAARQFHEAVGDLFGDALADRKFWDGLKDRNPGLFSKMAEVVSVWLQKVVDALKKLGFESSQYFTDIDRARAVAVEALSEFSKTPFKDSRMPAIELRDPSQNLYSGKKARPEIEAALDRINKNPTQRLAMFERARKKLTAIIEATRPEIEAMEFSRGAKPAELAALGMEKAGKLEIRHQKLLQSIGELNALLSVFPAEIRGKVGGFATLANIGTGEKALTDFMVKRIEMLDVEMERALKKEYRARFAKILDRAKPKKNKPGEKPSGKLGKDVHTLFDSIREAMEYTPDDAAAETAKIDAQIATGALTAAEEAHQTQLAGMIALVADWKHADAARMSEAVKSAQEIFERGYLQFQNKKADQRDRRKAIREGLKADTGKAGTPAERDARALADNGLKAGWRNVLLGLLNFEQTAKWVFGDSSNLAQSIADAERKAAYRKEDRTQAKMDALADLFTRLAGDRYKGEQLRWDMAQKTMPVQGRMLSQTEAITALLIWRQEDGKRHMLGLQDETGKFISPWNYDQTFIDDIERQLTREAREVMRFLSDAYSKEWNELNPIYSELYGVNLPRHGNYAPLTVKPTQEKGMTVDPVTGSTMSSGSATPGSLRTRGSSTAEPDFKDALQTYIAHTKQMEHWMAYAPFVSEARAVLGNRDLGNSIEAAAGEQALTVLRGWLNYFEQGGNRDAAASLALYQGIGRVTNRAASIALVGRIGTLAIQSTQLAAGVAEMPVGAFVPRLAKLFSGQLGWRAALDSPYIQRRIQQMPPALQQAMEGLRAEKPSLLKHQVQKIGQLLSGVDGLFTAGTFAIVRDYQLGQAAEMGLTGAEAEAHALNAAERAVDRIAQPTRPGARSLFENNATSPLYRLVWAFASESRKNLGLIAYTWAKTDAGRAGRAILYAGVLNAVMAEVIRSAWRDARDGEDDEWFDEKNWNLKRMTLSAMSSPFGGVPVFGDMVEAGAFRAAGQYMPDGNILSGGPKAITAMMRIDDILAGEQDVDEILRDVDVIISGIGVANSNIAAAASLSHLVRDIYGVGENIVADPEE